MTGCMLVLFIGGTGLISSACSAAAVAAGHELWLVNRGKSRLPAAVGADHVITADATDARALREALQGREWDVVVQWVGYLPDHVADDIETFAGVGQYIFISSASAYEKPPSHWMVSESTPLVNPYWDYSRNKIACESLLFDAWHRSRFPITVIRPSLTYGPSQIPVVIGSWDRPFTIVDRIRRGAPIIVPGDGTSIWTITHNSDFAKGLLGLSGNRAAIGEDFHITSDESLTWDQIYLAVGEAAGAVPNILHVPSDGIIASNPDELGNLWGDKAHSTVFDNSKLLGAVPDFKATVPFSAGIKETIAWFDQAPDRQAIDGAANERWDRLAAVYEEALRRAAG
ncbi:MAG TPA: NAD-dependent epimerase/dehydratase family protein [Acidimicrobiales bacterium]|nr:NAD-dependent epimerase/dehydratase family protein [Acidimicrobiales bacterium]